MEVANVNDTATSLLEQSSNMNISSAMSSVTSSKSVQSVQTKKVIESSTSVKSVTTSSMKSHRSVEVEEEIEYIEDA
ncbi:hypothetical protein G9C98_006079 [Cotesia typhae]|uniref:Uncharacterized protein n=2 Tax=Cotesia TaxID=32390 RepID=A0A8J5R3U4_9HYME|nr:hypothetical protein G9C98_006079 [Cotesia typhae]KAH0569183.1 hypothetical protein KQX54_021899 [Cotesia glomerata]